MPDSCRFPQLATCHHLGPGGVVADGQEQIAGQVDLAAGLGEVGLQVHGVHREAVLGQQVLLREIAEKMLVNHGADSELVGVRTTAVPLLQQVGTHAVEV